MFERIIEIIAYVISEVKRNKSLNEIDVNELENRGYTSSEISTAFSWLVDRMEFAEHLFISDSTESNSFRILHPYEQELFSKESWGEIIGYHSLGIISNIHIEALIDKSIMMGLRQINPSQLKSMIGVMIFNSGPFSQINGSRFLLNGNDTIN